MNILDIHSNCLDFLLDYQLKTKDFYFVPRKINNKNRLEQGMYFRGNEKYMVLSFWDSADTNEFIYNVNFSVSDNGCASIEISCRDDEEKLPHIIAIKNLIETTGKIFTETKKSRWRYFYPKDYDYLEALHEFILNEKPLIDEYVLSHKDCGLPLADKELDNKYVKSLPGYKIYIETATKAKKTGAVTVKASEHIMIFQHNQLSNELVNYLSDNGYTSVVTDEDFVDIKATDSVGTKLFFELKTATTVKNAIRQALGQLLEYNHYPNNNKADKLIIVTVLEPTKEDIQYLQGLRTVYQIPVYYQQFDMDKKELLTEC